MNRKQRHMGRELALRWLFQIDVGNMDPDDVMAARPEDLSGLDEEGRNFAEELARGVLDDQVRIDALLVKYAKGWPLTRMAAIDRNVLRIALYEILDIPDIPPSVSVDEAVEIAKHYSTDESGKFVNGILGAYLREEHGGPAIA